MVWSAIEACTNDKSHLTQLHVIPCFTVCLIIAESDCIDYQTLKWVHRWMIISPFNKGGHKGKLLKSKHQASMMYAYSHWPWSCWWYSTQEGVTIIKYILLVSRWIMVLQLSWYHGAVAHCCCFEKISHSSIIMSAKHPKLAKNQILGM